MKKMRMAIQLYSVRTDLEKDFEGTLRQLKEFGYAGVEFAGLCGRKPEQVRKILRGLGLEAVGAHVPLSEFRADTDRVIADYQTVGCAFLVIPMLEADERPGSENWAETAELLTRISRKTSQAGMPLLYHSHDMDFDPYGNGVMLDEICGASSDILAEPDTCWASVAGEDPVMLLGRLQGRVPLVHIKDFELYGPLPAHLAERFGRSGTGAHRVEYRPVGYGMQDLPGLISACRSAGTLWAVVEEDEPDSGRTRMECARLSAQSLLEFL